jgi:hypothetical protein
MKEYCFRICCGDGRPFEDRVIDWSCSAAEMRLRNKHPAARQVTLIRGVPVSKLNSFSGGYKF